MANSRQQLLDFSQLVIKPIAIDFLTASGADSKLIEKLKEGYCSGIAAVILLAFWLSSQPPRFDTSGKTIPRDDLAWLRITLLALIMWKDNPQALSPQDFNNINRFISRVEFYQNLPNYLDNAGQGDLDRLDNGIKREFSIAGCFTFSDFFKLIELKNGNTSYNTSLFEILTLNEDNLVFISSAGHDIGLFFHNQFFLINANNQKLFTEFSNNTLNKIQLVQDIFTAGNYNINIPSPFGFRIFSLQSNLKKYPNTTELLTQLKLPMSPPPNYGRNTTSLDIACLIGCFESVTYYLNQNIEINTQDTHGFSPLDTSIHHNRTAIAKLLLSKGAETLKDKPYDLSPFRAIKNHNNEIFFELVNYGLSLEHKDQNNNTLLHTAAYNNNVGIIKYLIKFGTSLNQINNFNLRPLDYAISANNAEATRILLQAGATASSNHYFQALFYFARMGNIDIIKELIKTQMPLDTHNMHNNGYTALHYAAYYGHIEIVKHLISSGANLDVSNCLGQTPLHLAIENDQIVIAKELLNNHASSSLCSFNGETPLLVSLRKNHLDLCIELITKGAKLEFEGKLALHTAAHAENIPLITLLLAKGVNINAQDLYGFTALHYAASKNNQYLINFLLMRGANPAIRTYAGNFAYELATAPANINLLNPVRNFSPFNMFYYPQQQLQMTHISVPTQFFQQRK